MKTASITFISGGVRSGKSSFAERLAIKKALEMGGSLHYIATGDPSDDEMKERIVRHQKDRNESGSSWKTWEQATDIGSVSSCFNENDVLLLDCLTTLLSNELFSHEQDWGNPFFNKEEVFHRIWTGIKALEKNCHHLVLVSNEVLSEPCYNSELMITYCQLIGKLHQQITSIAKQAYVVEAGIPLLMKGDEG
ncbi:bifunctional adenosylcobinamide kinase/adenosylcobinamide-phosphate guanylyltransferase [Oceanobacillus salinisoli]|uniref:bifunctional adenosylcobinamide kinase/adenosylcobinamide-phosphate guanylyltransferase n=1 Tax=Oceanobacillus salinisoli TaxID=2678611 RepID=UPI0012E2603A|nr:bifunctional adenosylcobinamide kinase/adenosylcobinamide-phosphate guanylyltransferase [Oceanobacillus salinisoli]